ncbi:MAG: ABC transporter ATP-binding protein/permease [Coriobacteriia bacterium]|nr:ABC transporter ATP-binding protein/permease [Coriobacteriia bacterium]
MVGSGEKAADFMGTLKRLLKILSKNYITLIIIALFTVAAVACSISGPKIMEKAINKIQEYVQMQTTFYPMAKQVNTQLNDAEKQLSAQEQQAAAAKPQLDAALKVLEAQQAQINQLPEPQRSAAQAQLDAKMAPLKTKEAGLKELAAARVKMDETNKQLDIVKNGKTDAERIAALRKLAAAIPSSSTGGVAANQAAQIKGAPDAQMLLFAKALALESSPKMDFNYIGMICLGLVVLYLGYALFSGFQQRMTVRITQELVRLLRRQVSEKLDRLPLKFFDGQTHGEILSKLTIDIDLMSTNLQNVMSQSMTSVLMFVGIIIMMFTVNWLLALISCIIVPLALLMTAVIAPRAQRYFGRQQAQLGELNGQIEEDYGGHNIIKAFNREQISIDRFKGTNEIVYDSAWKAQFLASVLYPVIIFAVNLQYVFIVVLGAVFTRPTAYFLGINVGGLTVGALFAFIAYLQQFQQPMQQMAQIANLIQSSMAAAERVFILLDEGEEAPDPVESPVIESPQGAVQVADINFDYDPAVPLIRDWNMMTEPGKMVAIVGPTGAGKTTIVNLLMRFYEVNSGTITVDGVDTSVMKRADVRKMFGMVLQDTWLYSGTIRENIAYGKDDATEEEIVRAADTALADHFIRTLPHGYDTEIQEDAGNLSSGQRQLLTIARAFLADAPILILDEATSSVDTRTEQLIQAAMERLMHGRTSFVIAHRLSTIRNADQILVMNHGRIVESGNHDQLLAADGFYAELYNSQFAGDEDA